MKTKLFLAIAALTSAMSASAQSDYIVLTKGARPAAAKQQTASSQDEQQNQPQDFLGKNFHYYSLCDWQPGMKFMVIPDRRDLIINTFCDAATGREVGNGSLRHKIFTFKEVVHEGNFSRVLFDCPADGKQYYFQVPFGSFDEYCAGKLGIPTLAYLGDVDKAREVLVGKHVITKTKKYYADSGSTAGGTDVVELDKNQMVKVVAAGVGTRQYPVKVICEDRTGRQFFMNVAMSRTNSGMDDADFEMDEKVHSFYGAFEVVDDAEASKNGPYGKYVGNTLFLRTPTTMTASDGSTVQQKRFTQYRVLSVIETGTDKLVLMTLQNIKTGEQLEKEVLMSVVYVPGDNVKNRFADLFGEGNARPKGTSDAIWAHMQNGEVVRGMTEEQVRLTIGQPDKKAKANSGNHDWIYTLRHVVIKFDAKGKVKGVVRG